MDRNSQRDQEITDAHRLFLQVFVSKRILLESEAEGTFQRILSNFKYPHPAEKLESFITTINSGLNFLLLEIRKVVGEEDGKIYWGLANIKNDAHAQMATSYGIPEITLFRKIVLELVASETYDSGEIRLMDAINLARDIPNITLSKAEQTLKKLVEEQWLCQMESNNDRRLSLGVRSFLELKPWLEDVVGEEKLPECVICQETIVRGLRCQNQRCATKIHFHCAQRWFSGRNALSPKCPTCSHPWNLQTVNANHHLANAT